MPRVGMGLIRRQQLIKAARAAIDGDGLASHTLAAVIDGLRLREAVGLGMTALAGCSDVG